MGSAAGKSLKFTSGRASRNTIAELDGNNNVVSRFVFGTRPNIPDYLIKDGKNYRIIADHLGSPRLVVEVETGDVVQRMDLARSACSDL